MCLGCACDVPAMCLRIFIILHRSDLNIFETLRVIVATPQSFLEVENLYRFFG